MRPFIALIWLVLLALPASSHAARPMITDDARIVDPRSCQVESWAKFNKQSTEYWALPGCNLGGNLELTLGGARTKADGESHASDVVMQVKTLLRPLKANDYGVGLTFGQVSHPNTDRSSSMVGDAYLNIPVSISFADDRFVLHTNLGAIHDRDQDRNRLTWGVGSETRLNSDLQLIAEVYGDDRTRAFHHLGLRYWVVPNRVQVDTTYGNRFANDSEERWFTIGLRLLSPPMLPF
jgi:hypothetical protein